MLIPGMRHHQSSLSSQVCIYFAAVKVLTSTKENDGSNRGIVGPVPDRSNTLTSKGDLEDETTNPDSEKEYRDDSQSDDGSHSTLEGKFVDEESEE